MEKGRRRPGSAGRGKLPYIHHRVMNKRGIAVDSPVPSKGSNDCHLFAPKVTNNQRVAVYSPRNDNKEAGKKGQQERRRRVNWMVGRRHDGTWTNGRPDWPTKRDEMRGRESGPTPNNHGDDGEYTSDCDASASKLPCLGPVFRNRGFPSAL